jgi:hypothetical protein
MRSPTLIQTNLRRPDDLAPALRLLLDERLIEAGVPPTGVMFMLRSPSPYNALISLALAAVTAWGAATEWLSRASST